MEFDIAAFRAAFPEFADEDIYPDTLIQAQADKVPCFLGLPTGCGCDTLQAQLMVAHLLTIATRTAAGMGGGGPVTAATIDKVAVTLLTPPAKDAYTYWLNTTPYGTQLAALLARCGSGGIYIGGLPERSAFRSAGGFFPRGGRRW